MLYRWCGTTPLLTSFCFCPEDGGGAFLRLVCQALEDFTCLPGSGGPPQKNKKMYIHRLFSPLYETKLPFVFVFGALFVFLALCRVLLCVLCICYGRSKEKLSFSNETYNLTCVCLKCASNPITTSDNIDIMFSLFVVLFVFACV